jgi:hypothetical protein
MFQVWYILISKTGGNSIACKLRWRIKIKLILECLQVTKVYAEQSDGGREAAAEGEEGRSRRHLGLHQIEAAS